MADQADGKDPKADKFADSQTEQSSAEEIPVRRAYPAAIQFPKGVEVSEDVLAKFSHSPRRAFRTLAGG